MSNPILSDLKTTCAIVQDSKREIVDVQDGVPRLTSTRREIEDLSPAEIARSDSHEIRKLVASTARWTATLASKSDLYTAARSSNQQSALLFWRFGKRQADMLGAESRRLRLESRVHNHA